MNPKLSTVLIAHEEITKTRALLFSAINELLGAEAERRKIELCHESVMGQILHQAHMRSPQAPLLIRKENATIEEIECLARHITEFSLAGIRQIKMAIEERSAGR
jgi:hypothetical protein